MKIRIVYFIISVLLILLTGCSTPDKLPAILPYEITGEKYDTSALIEYLPHPDDRVNKFMLENLKNNGYTVLQGVNYQASPPKFIYIVQVVDWSSRVYECEDNDYLDTRLIVMVRRPGMILDNQMYAGSGRYFQTYSQLLYMGKEVKTGGLKLAADHLFMTKEFRKALEPAEHLKTFVFPQNNGKAYWAASCFFQHENRFDFYESLKWALLAMYKGNKDAEKYVAENGIFGELFTDKNLLIKLAEMTPAGLYNLGRMYEYNLGIPVNRKKAFLAYSAAAWRKHTEAKFALGRCYHYGIGTARNRSLAHHWYKNALAESHPEAQAALDRLQEDDFDR